MTIKAASAEYKAMVQQKLGEKFHVIADDMERVRASGTVDGALKVGQSAPDFTLPDAFGNQVSLGNLLTRGPVVISFYRGEWCPFCNLELRGLQEALPQMKALGATLIAVSPEKPDNGIIATEKNKLTFPVLSDCSGSCSESATNCRRFRRTFSRTTSRCATARTHTNCPSRRLM